VSRAQKGRPFHVEGPTTEKAPFCLVEIRDGVEDGEDLVQLNGGSESSKHIGCVRRRTWINSCSRQVGRGSSSQYFGEAKII